MASLNGFDAREVEPNQGFTPIPDGDYKIAIVSSENKRNSKDNGSYLALTIEVLDGKYKGRKLFENLNLDNPNPKAVEIAKGDLSAICRAVNVLTPRDSVELHNKPMMAKVAVTKRSDNGELTNSIKKYKSLSEAAAEAEREPVAAGMGPAPWEK